MYYNADCLDAKEIRHLYFDYKQDALIIEPYAEAMASALAWHKKNKSY